MLFNRQDAKLANNSSLLKSPSQLKMHVMLYGNFLATGYYVFGLLCIGMIIIITETSCEAYNMSISQLPNLHK